MVTALCLRLEVVLAGFWFVGWVCGFGVSGTRCVVWCWLLVFVVFVVGCSTSWVF